MSSSNYNDRFDDITYENGWQRASSPEIYVPPMDAPQPGGKKKRRERAEKDSLPREKRPFHFLLLTVQLIVCALLLAAALVFKQFGAESYNELKAAYFQQLNNSVFETPSDNILDLSEIFSSGSNEG